MLTAPSHAHMSSVFVWSTSGVLAGDKSSQHECTSFVIAALEALIQQADVAPTASCSYKKLHFPIS